MSFYNRNRGGVFDKQLRVVLDAMLKDLSRYKANDRAQVIQIVERVKRPEARAALRSVLIFCFEFNDRASLPVHRTAVIAPLADFLADYNIPLSTTRGPVATWQRFVEHIRFSLAQSRAYNRFRDWLILPPRLFRKAHALAEAYEDYRRRRKGLPLWSKVDAVSSQDTAAPKVKLATCWLKERDRNVRWKQHCWNQCVLVFLSKSQFTNEEIARSLDSGDCRGRLAYCKSDFANDDGDSGPTMGNGSTADSGGDREDSGAERRARAEAFAAAQTQDDKIEELVANLLTPPSCKPRPAASFSWNGLAPRLRFAGAALAFLLVAAAVAVVSLRPPVREVHIAALLFNDSLRSGAPSVPAFIQALPNQVETTFTLSQGRVVLSTPKGDRIELSGFLTNSSVAGGLLWIGSPIVSGKIQGGQPVTGSGRIRIRTKSAIELSKAKQEDFDWVSIELDLTASRQTGRLSLILGSP